jgi:hypothetical protein
VVLRIPAGRTNLSLYGILTLSDRPFQNVRVCRCIVLLVLQPRPGQSQTGLGCSRFARHYYGNLMLISLRRATEMFQFAHCPPSCLCVQQAVSRHYSGGVAPFGVSGLIARMQLPLNVSPVSASFIGLQRLGIHLVLCVACFRLCVPLLLSCSSAKLKKEKYSVVYVQIVSIAPYSDRQRRFHGYLRSAGR